MFFLKNKIRQWQESKWLLGICQNGYDDLKSGHIQWVDNGEFEGKKWFADPFIFDYDDKQIFLLVEEFDYKIHRGRIAKITIDRQTWTIVKCDILLDLPTHLSFPMIWQEGDDIYVCPENYASGGWNLYKYNPNTESLDLVKLLIGEKLTDATLCKINKYYYLLSTYDPRPNGPELTIWKSDDLFGTFVKSQCVRFDENIGRNAGKIFEFGGQLIRPAQECNHNYGNALVFQQVKVDEGMLSFSEEFRYYSTHNNYKRGTHTFNLHPKGMAVIDVKNYRYPTMGRLLSIISEALVKLHIKKRFQFQ